VRGRERSFSGQPPHPTDIGYALAGLTAVGIICIGARFLLAPSTAAAGFGIAAWHDGGKADPYPSVKGVRGATAVVLPATAALLFT
jgi:hypothetical protein